MSLKTSFPVLIGFLMHSLPGFAQIPADTSGLALPEVLVRGNFPAYLQALKEQQQAQGIVSILNLDLPGRFPDLNPAEALQRLPGIVVQRSQGEGRFVHIRGADPALTTVQVNGEQIVSPESRNRFLQFDLLPVDQLRSVEAWKTNCPDQDGDAVGGSINLLTRRPSGGKPEWQASGAAGFNPAAGKPSGQVQLAFSGKNLMLNGSLWQDHRATENLETLYGIRDAGLDKQWYITDLELRNFEVARRRLGLSAEYRVPFQAESGGAYVRGMFAGFAEKNLRQRLRYRPGAGVHPGISDTTLNATIGRDVQYVEEKEQFAALQAGFEHTGTKWTIDGALAGSYGLESEPLGRQLDFNLTGVDLLRNGNDARFPEFRILNGASAEAYDNYVLNALETEDEHSTDRSITAKLNAQYRLKQQGDYLKFGVKTRIRNKKSRATEGIYDQYAGSAPLSLPGLLESGASSGFLGGRYTFGQRIDWTKTQTVIDAHFADFQRNELETALESTAGNFNIQENTEAAYALAHFARGRWEGLAGARLEYTRYRYSADQVSIDSLGVTRIPNGRAFSGRYAFLLPTLLAKFHASNGWNWQSVFSGSYARPTFDQLAPFEVFNQLDGTVLAGNPDLRPAQSWNLDLSAERSLPKGGAVSAGIFGKYLQHFIFMQQRRGSRLWNGQPVDVLISAPLNGEGAWLAGAELSWQQRLAFLPGAWSGLGVYANYTYTWSLAIADEDEGSGDAGEAGFRLPGQAAHSGNLSVWYDRGRWSGRLALNAQSDFLLQAAEPEDAESQLFYGGSIQLDANIGFALGRRITLFAEGMNLLNTPLRYFSGDKDHPSKLEYYGAWGRVGLKVNW